jgi:curved DNA-binding protein CbpA
MSRKMSHYEVLRVPENATPEQIKSAWHAIAKKTHPDRNPGDDERAKRAERVFKRCSEAWDVLSDPELRQAYDATLHPPDPMAGKPMCTSCGAPVLVAGQVLCVRCSIIDRVPKRKSSSAAETYNVDMGDVFASSAKDFEQPLPSGTGSLSLLEGLLAESSIRGAFNGENSGDRRVIEVQQGKTRLRIEIDPESITALHRNLKTGWKIFKLARDILG